MKPLNNNWRTRMAASATNMSHNMRERNRLQCLKAVFRSCKLARIASFLSPNNPSKVSQDVNATVPYAGDFIIVPISRCRSLHTRVRRRYITRARCRHVVMDASGSTVQQAAEPPADLPILIVRSSKALQCAGKDNWAAFSDQLMDTVIDPYSGIKIADARW